DGNDTLFGDAGNDTIAGDGGAKDLLVGGNGIDTVSYHNTNVGVFVNLGLQGSVDKDGLPDGKTAPGTQGTNSFETGDELYGFENITGGGGQDFLIGDDNANVIKGGASDDELQGGKGTDSLFGEGDNDFLTGGAGIDTLDGGAGDDTASYDGEAAGI